MEGASSDSGNDEPEFDVRDISIHEAVLKVQFHSALFLYFHTHPHMYLYLIFVQDCVIHLFRIMCVYVYVFLCKIVFCAYFVIIC